MRYLFLALLPLLAAADWRDIRTGSPIPSEGYCDQPYIVRTQQGHWLCVLTTGKGKEGDLGQHVVATTSTDHGKTWSPLVDIEPADGPEASWVVPLITPAGRVYAFYDYNGDRVAKLGAKKIRADMLGWYCWRYSDDGGKSWSAKRYRLPVRTTAADRGNDWKGDVQIFWGIDKPKADAGAVLFGFTKLGRYMLDDGEGWFFRSENVLTEKDPEKVRWEMVGGEDRGVRRADFGSVQEEHNAVPLGDDKWYCVYRTTRGHPAEAYSADGGQTWSEPAAVTLADGRVLKHPRACPKLWRTEGGKLLLWHHFHGGTSFEGRNPAWVSGGLVEDGKVRWSQPEVLLYDDNPKVRMSYPDLIEEDGKVWISETQKEIARVHAIDPTLLAGLWKPPAARVADKPLLDADVRDGVDAPKLPALQAGTGFTVEVRFTAENADAGRVLLDGRDEKGRGVRIVTDENATIRVELGDGERSLSWRSDANTLRPGRPQVFAAIVDGGPRLVTLLVDGVLCDGGKDRPAGWTRLPAGLVDANGPTRWRGAGRVTVYGRPLRHYEAAGNAKAE